MPRPSFCPNCGKPLPAGPQGAQPFSEDVTGIEGRGWDCYCDACTWSGDIMPDNEADPVFTTLESSKESAL